MSNLIDNAYTQLNNLIQINADDIQTESINTKALYINNILFDPSGNYISDYVTLSTAQSISNKAFTGTTIFSSIQLNSDLIVNSGGTTITNSQLQLIPNISTNTTNVAALQLLLTDTSYDSEFSFLTFADNIRIQGNLILGSSPQMDVYDTLSNLGTTYITNTNLSMQLSNYALLTSLNNYVLTSALSSYVTNTSLASTLGAYVTSTNLTNQLSAYLTLSDLANQLSSYVTSSTLSSTLNSYVKTSVLVDYVSTNTFTTELNNYVLASALNTALANYITSSYLTSQLSNYVLASSLSSTLNDYVTKSSLTLTLSDYIKTSELNIKLSDYALVSSLNTTNSNVTALQNKLVDIAYDAPSQYFDIYNNCHIYKVLKLGLILNVEASIDALGVSVGVAGGAAAKATTDILTINNITLPAMNLVSAGLSLRIDNLETKTTNMTYNLALNTTYISATLSLTTVRLNSLDSGILQTANQSVVFIGETEIRNDFSVTNGFGMSCDGGIIQNNNSQNTFRGGLKVNNTLECNDFTSGGTNSNINSTNTNINSTTCNISGNTIIKNMSEITSGTIAPYLSILSTKLNTNNRKLQGLLIGKEQLVANEECNCNIGFNYAFGGFENYGYLGLTNGTKEAFRWYETGNTTGCSLPTGDLTVSEGGIVISSGDIKVNTINNRSTNLNINGSYALNINSNTINIGTNQGIVPPAFNTINIGNVASLSVINLNGLVYSPFAFNITGAITQWT